MDSHYTYSGAGKKVFWWLVANAVIPVLIPVVCIWGANWMFSFPNITFCDLFKNFMAQGYYIFSALTLICSLFEDYKALKYCIDPLQFIVIGILLTLTMGMFYLQYVNNQYLQSHYLQFMSVWVALVVYAIYLKYKIVISIK